MNQRLLSNRLDSQVTQAWTFVSYSFVSFISFISFYKLALLVIIVMNKISN